MTIEDLDDALAYFEKFSKAGGLASHKLPAIRADIAHVRDAVAKCDSDDKDVIVRRMATFTKKNGSTYSSKRCEERYVRVVQLLDVCNFLKRQTALPWGVDGTEIA